MYDSVYVYKPAMKLQSLDSTAKLLSDALGITREEVGRRIAAASTRWTALAHRIPSSAAAQIETAGLDGVVLRRLPQREYPEGSLASSLLGFVGMDGHGLSGIELTLEQELAGKPGVVITERDPIGDEITLARKAVIPAEDGADLVLSIDRHIQRLVERELAAAVQANKGTGGVAIVMEPTTGDVLAMASVPTFSLTKDMPLRTDQQHLYNTSPVTNTYEPGSVMKLITLAAGLEERAVSPESRYLDTGLAVVAGAPIRNWDHSAHGSVTVTDIIVRSLNTGSQWIAGRVGADRFYDYLDGFGFGTATGIRLNGEASGFFRRPPSIDWSPVDLATNSFGQSISVTPIQMVTAVAAMANNGVLMRPRLVKEIRTAEGTRHLPAQSVRAAVSPATAEAVTRVMVEAWSQPALAANRLTGYTLAAKSGTADIPGAGGYETNRTYASYIGYGPIPEPKFVTMVRIDQPEGLYGGVVAAPVFRAICAEILSYLRIPPDDVRPATADGRPTEPFSGAGVEP
jgi:cell division protein FtsI/penicillin-binding protein 2